MRSQPKFEDKLMSMYKFIMKFGGGNVPTFLREFDMLLAGTSGTNKSVAAVTQLYYRCVHMA